MKPWVYATPGIPDDLFERLPGIPLTKCEVRLLMIGHIRLRADSIFWDIGAGTGTIPIELSLLCPSAKIIAIERDPEVAGLIAKNCHNFATDKVEIINGTAPDCLKTLDHNPDRILIEGGRSVKELLDYCWQRLAIGGRIIATAVTLEGLYATSESFANLHVRNIEVVQTSVNRLETRGNRRVFAAVNPIFILSGDKVS